MKKQTHDDDILSFQPFEVFVDAGAGEYGDENVSGNKEQSFTGAMYHLFARPFAMHELDSFGYISDFPDIPIPLPTVTRSRSCRRVAPAPATPTKH